MAPQSRPTSSGCMVTRFISLDDPSHNCNCELNESEFSFFYLHPRWRGRPRLARTVSRILFSFRLGEGGFPQCSRKKKIAV